MAIRSRLFVVALGVRERCELWNLEERFSFFIYILVSQAYFLPWNPFNFALLGQFVL